MKKIYILILLPFLILTNCKNKSNSNQNVNEDNSVIIEENRIKNLHTGCNYDRIADHTEIIFTEASERQKQQIAAIMQYVGLPSNFDIMCATGIGNALAFFQENRRYIIYDPKLLSYVDENSSEYWSSMSILAHEIGHHLSNHTLSNSGSNIQTELEADQFSGFVLYKMGASLKQAQKAINMSGTEYKTSSHPAKNNRLKAIEKGWNEANKLRFEEAVPPVPNDDDSYSNVEFKKENLLNLSEYISDGGETEMLEGIVVRSNHKGQECDVLITKGEDFDFIPYNQDGSIPISIIVDDEPSEWRGYNAYNDLYHLLVPGRRIKFKIIIEGQARHAFFSYVAHKNHIAQKNEIQRSKIEGVFQVSSNKAYFHSEAELSTQKSAYLVHGESGNFLMKENGFIYVIFENKQGKFSKGWISIDDVILFE